ncbi:MAG: rod shape-determining protein MreC [Bdellovibrionales bacterium]
MNFWNLNWRKVALITVAALLPLLTINMEQKGRETFWIKQPFQMLAGLAEDVFYDFSYGIRSTASFYLNLLDIKKLNSSLLQENAQLKTRLELLKELELENTRLRDLLQFRQKSKMQLIAARVIGRDLIPDHNTLTLDKGERDGLKSGQAVITLKGVVGLLLRVEENRSHVMLVTDRYSVVDGLVQRTRAQGIVEGRGGNETFLNLKYIDRTTDLTKGDVIVTSDLDRVFPKGYPLAVVERVEDKTYSVALKIELKPIIESSEIEEVFVVLNTNAEDFSTPTPATAETGPISKEGTP